MRLILALILLSAGPAFAQLAAPLLQTCARATEGASTSPWVQCDGGSKFAPISPDAMVATGDFQQGTWRKFSDLPGETMVAVCPAGANLETETRCRTSDGTSWATKFVRKDSLPGAAWQITFRWQPMSQYDDGSPITTPVTYVLTWYGTDATGTPNTTNSDVETAGPPLVVTVPQQRICARLRAKANGVLGDLSQEVCIARKPGIPVSVTVEFGSP